MLYIMLQGSGGWNFFFKTGRDNSSPGTVTLFFKHKYLVDYPHVYLIFKFHLCIFVVVNKPWSMCGDKSSFLEVVSCLHLMGHKNGNQMVRNCVKYFCLLTHLNGAGVVIIKESGVCVSVCVFNDAHRQFQIK